MDINKRQGAKQADGVVRLGQQNIERMEQKGNINGRSAVGFTLATLHFQKQNFNKIQEACKFSRMWYEHHCTM